MIEKPKLLSETPLASTDLLSDLLASMHLSGMVLFRTEFREPWSVLTPSSRQLASVLPFRSAHILPFHVIASGGCWLEMPEHERVWLQAGDAVLLPYGDVHRLSGRDLAPSIPVSELLPPPPWPTPPILSHGGSGNAAGIICGFLQCDEMLFHPLLRNLPGLLHVRTAQNSPDVTATDHWLASTIRHLANEATQPMAGSRSVLQRLTELMFVEMLRKHMQGLSTDEIGWLAAFKDQITGTALRCLHAEPLAEWSVDRLSRRVGVSRTVLAERFRHFLDQPPMQYLAHWRLQLAAQQMKVSDLPLKTIAEQGGYESEAAFSRAFKRHFGLPPGEWRRRQSITP